MLFNSYIFIFLFLPISLFGYYSLNHYRCVAAAKIWLLGTSFVFYSWWNIAYLPILLVSIIINYIISHWLIQNKTKKRKNTINKSLLVIGLVFNIGLLGYFKYADFFLENAALLSNTEPKLLHLALPLGISFFTLQQIGFLIDTYEGLAKERRFLDYALFVAFFPQLVAGPIVHHKQMMPQFAILRNKIFNYKNFTLGLFIFSIGLFKKIVIADTFAIWANQGFDMVDSLNFFSAWATSLNYTFQLYFDFSGYTDMAIGIGLMFNIKLPLNFNSPYKATSIINFWQRWHMTLSRFITTYVYVPLLKSMPGQLTFTKTLLAIFIAMLISGIWHGAAWTFAIWGCLHGIALVINHCWRKLKIKLPIFWAWFLTFNFINVSFVVFRASNWEDARKVIAGMFDIMSLQQYANFSQAFLTINADVRHTVAMITMLVAFGLITFLGKNSSELAKSFKPNNKMVLLHSIILIVSLFSLEYTSEFLYFEF